MSVRIERITRAHDREDFDCGEQSLNEYLAAYARQNTQKGVSTTYVAVGEDSSRVLAYYSIASGQVARESMPAEEQRRLPGYPVPVVKVGRLATDQRSRGLGLGQAMLIDALKRADLVSRNLGVYAVEVDALNDGARAFYEKYGFQSLEDDPLHMFLSMKTVQRLLGG